MDGIQVCRYITIIAVLFVLVSSYWCTIWTADAPVQGPIPAPVVVTTSDGAVSACECSSQIYFGEGRVECFPNRTHQVDSRVSICIVHLNSLQVNQVTSLHLQRKQPNNYAVIRDGIPDIFTDVIYQDDTAVVTTYLKPDWFIPNQPLTIQVGVRTSGDYELSRKRSRQLFLLMEDRPNLSIFVGVLAVPALLLGYIMLSISIRQPCSECNKDDDDDYVELQSITKRMVIHVISDPCGAMKRQMLPFFPQSGNHARPAIMLPLDAVL